ncbi:MAG: bifunctional riboflavin kinase/FAD synthetase [Gammaproteobacteria bacterium]
MQLIRGLHNINAEHRGCVATIGTFDGVHLGHKAVLNQLAEHAKRLNLPAVVITFEPTPQEFFTPETAPARLSRLREKLETFQQSQVDYVLCLRFDDGLASLDADEFVGRVLVNGLQIRYLVVGDDFRFGRERKGDFDQLIAAGKMHDFPVENTATLYHDEQRVSSTRVRQALQEGDMTLASDLLGRPYTISGRVKLGQQRGRSIGFPTANIALHRNRMPLQGVFAVAVHGLEDWSLPGVANLGTRPTVDGVESILEAHIFDFDREIYGQHIQVEFVTKIREEKKFESFDALKQQIQMDALAARDHFSRLIDSKLV